MAYFIAIFIVIIQAVLFLTHWFLYRTIARFFGIVNPEMLLVLKWGLGIFSVTFVLASLLAFRYNNFFTRILYTAAAGWLGIFFFLFLAAALLRLGSLLPVNHRLLAEILFSIGLLAGVYSLINAGLVRVTTITVKLPNLPVSWQGKTAVWISDVHLGQIQNYGFAKKLAGKISTLNPDAVFIGGDLYDGVAVDVNKVIEPFASLKPPQGIYFITGNHEEFGDNAKFLEAVKRIGIKTLNDEAVDVGGLQIIGVDYHDSANFQRYQKIMEGIKIDPGKPSILLKHEPNNLAVAEQAGINLQISGHTHRAQVWPLSYIPKLTYKGYDYGLKMFGKMAVYTSSGAGTWGPPIRFLTYPEIVLIKFD